ncbi:DUF3108 domain-containing protein [Saccharospirillum salsuginis]|uniref:DUF3108 domain-containing protein n=1 Tax=Saccharospirillum salsuginis TaxID=418750 RepID=A0A918KJC2_9GAMM|nr:DUF3108 domain-containing protein [Saccharospirillum salsuginis]GGX65341.1 hypothetical protein GCM10007392_36510 [Saccharospirillum salsuginis]
MRQFIRNWLLVTAATLCTTQAAELVPFTAELEAIRYGAIDLSTEGTLRLRRDGSDWHYRLATDGRTVSLKEEVWLSVDGNQLLPLRYEFESKLFWVKNTKSLRFDHSENRVTGRVDKDRIDTRFEPPLYDAIGYQLELQQQLIDGEREISFDVFRHKRPDRMAFRVIGEEMLDLPTGEVYTWIVEQTDPIGKNERKLIWVAPDLNFVPLRFGRYEKGKLKEEIRTLSLSLDGQRISFDP